MSLCRISDADAANGAAAMDTFHLMDTAFSEVLTDFC